MLFLKRKIGRKNGRRNVRKIGVPADRTTEFELKDTAANIQKRSEREQRERVKEPYKQQRKERERSNTQQRRECRK